MKTAKKLIAVISAVVLIVCAVLSAGCIPILFSLNSCNIKEEEDPGPISEVWFDLPGGELDYDFGMNTVTMLESYDADAHGYTDVTEKTLTDDEAAQYEELLTAVCGGATHVDFSYVFDCAPSCAAPKAGPIWGLWIIYESGEDDRSFVMVEPGDRYPFRWDEVALLTTELTGFDVSALPIEPNADPQKEIEELRQINMHFPDGLVSISYTDNNAQFFCGSSDTAEIVELTDEKLAKSKEFVTQFCEDIITRKSEFTGSDPEAEQYYEIDIFYNAGKSKFIHVTEDSERIYPDNWDKFAQVVYDLTGHDINELTQDFAQTAQ